ncbi:MAG: DUF3795 domain-containing protein [bacterium]|nr:DUF3795 domain-containing protein [bacterium]
MGKINSKLIAPCGMNCGICLHYLRAENKCTGCFSGRKVNGRPIKCSIKLCKDRRGEYCFDCDKFPCERLDRLDKRYRERYGMSEIENLEFIRDKGMDEFIKRERGKWQSDKGILCVHDKKYY